ncbi:bifunctional lysylphosphatidylglycerol flippase/synthetase MprF [Actinomycetospora sp. CA-084318]|uniref:bifunctional lysylphosphatidylglycerol flippase/synthetase MprF n=1 Tax=Actinomycetospora sp. CA-084318 TaxID=3239892 RepID=UPI003D988754
MTVTAPSAPAPATSAHRGHAVLAVARRVPFTAVVVVLMVVGGFVTGAFWNPLAGRPLGADLAYGVPSFADGKWWTVVTGALVAGHPALYVLTLGLFAVATGWVEFRCGTLRTAVVTIGFQLGAVLLTAGLVLAVAATDWPWAQALATDVDTGFSGGMMAALAMASATVRAPWRLRLRLLLVAVGVVGLLFLGGLADLEHALAVALSLPIAHRLAGSRAVPTAESSGPTLGRREWRLVAASGLVVIAAIRVITLVVPVVGPLGNTASDSTVAETAVSVVIALLLADGLRRGRRLAWVLGLVVGVFYLLLGLLVIGVVAYAHATGQMDQVELVGLAVFVPNAVLWSALTVWLVAGRRAFGVPSRRRRRTDPSSGSSSSTDGPELAQAALHNHGGPTISWMTTWPENRYLPTGDGGVVAYRVHAGVAVALGDPITDDVPTALDDFRALAERSGRIPCLFSTTGALAEVAQARGWRALQVAEDTVVDLEGLAFTGKPWQAVRSAFNRAGKAGIEHRLVHLDQEPRSVLAQVRAISEEWVGDKGLPEMGFTLGGVEEALDPEVRTGLAVDAEGTVHGVTSWLPVYGPDGVVVGWTLDVMRRRSEGFRAVVEYLIASACLAFQAEGARFVSLSGAPLARSERADAEPVLDRALDQLGAMLEPYYGFRSLHQFKAKFRPRHEPMFLVYRDEADLPRVGIGIGRAYLPDAGFRELIALAR